MPRTNAFIPVSKGIDQRLDERLRSPDSLTTVVNGEYVRNDALRKRHGFSALTTDMQGGGGAVNVATFGAPKALLSTGDELLIRGSRQLYAYQEGSATWTSAWWFRGELAPFTGKQRPLFADARSVGSCDMTDTSDGVVIHAQTVWNDNNPSTAYENVLCVSVEVPDGTIAINKFPLVSTDALNVSTAVDMDVTGCRTVSSRNGAALDTVFIGVQRNKGFTFRVTGNLYGTLEWYRWTSSAPTTNPTVPPSITHNDLYYPASSFGSRRRYDSCETGDGWTYAYIRDTTAPFGPTATSIAVYRKNDTLTLASVVIPVVGVNHVWESVAVHSSAATGQTYIAAQARDSATGQTFDYLYARNSTTLAAVWGPVSVGSLSAGTTPFTCSIGVVEGVDTGGTRRVVVVSCSENSTVVGNNHSRVQVSYVLTTGLTLQLCQTLWNAKPVSKPWFRDNRCYLALVANYRAAGGNNIDGYAGEAVADCAIGDPEDVTQNILRRLRMVGRYNYGVAASHQTLASMHGSLQTVLPVADQSVDRYATYRIVDQATGLASVALCGADEVELDFAGKTVDARTTRGTATIGGGNVSWYASCVTEELGWCSAPFIAETVSASGGSLATGVPYTYVCVFESFDEKGNLTRSTPGPPKQHTIAGANNSVSVRVCTLGPTQRYNKRRFSVALYRADQDGLFQRCIEKTRNADDNETLAFFDPVLRDAGSPNLEVLYTQGGAEVEASGPDGAAFVTTTSRRVWLAGFYRRDRVQYSKQYNPETASEYALAPEFNDAFSFLLPGGDACTGLVEMDDKVIVFTASNVYAIAGNGPDDGGRNNDFSGLQLVSGDTGCVDPRSVVSTPMGVFFQAPSGMFVLGRDLQLNFLGAAVRDITDAYTDVTSAVLVPAANHVRFTMRSGNESVILCYDFNQNCWLKWQPKRNDGATQVVMNIVGACLHDSHYHVLEANGTVYYEDPNTFFDDTSIYIPMTVETSWLQAAQQSGWQRIRTVAAMCERFDNHDLTISLAQDFGNTSQSYTWTAAVIANQKLQELVEMRAQTQKCTSFKIAISDAAAADASTVTGQGYKLLGFQVELGGKRGLYKPGTQQRN